MWKWILGLIVVALAIKYWPIVLACIALVLLLAHIRRNAATDPGPLKPARKPAPKLKPQPVPELPAPEYLPRWTASRRTNTGREHDQWQREFDRA
jgi:hypothetical protein